MLKENQRISEGKQKNTSGEGWFSRYDATAMLSMRPCTALQADATSIVPLKWNEESVERVVIDSKTKRCEDKA
jgi:hypothetical protein